LPDRVLDHLQLLAGGHGGFPIDRLTHSLQTATLAHEDGRDEEYVVCALLHDIGDSLGAYNHPDIAAAILRPFVSPANLWMVEKHGLFQSYYMFATSWTATCATRCAATATTATRRSSACATTTARSIRGGRTGHWRSSSRWCTGCSRGPGSVCRGLRPRGRAHTFEISRRGAPGG